MVMVGMTGLRKYQKSGCLGSPGGGLGWRPVNGVRPRHAGSNPAFLTRKGADYAFDYNIRGCRIVACR